MHKILFSLIVFVIQISVLNLSEADTERVQANSRANLCSIQFNMTPKTWSQRYLPLSRIFFTGVRKEVLQAVDRSRLYNTNEEINQVLLDFYRKSADQLNVTEFIYIYNNLSYFSEIKEKNLATRTNYFESFQQLLTEKTIVYSSFTELQARKKILTEIGYIRNMKFLAEHFFILDFAKRSSASWNEAALKKFLSFAHHLDAHHAVRVAIVESVMRGHITEIGFIKGLMRKYDFYNLDNHLYSESGLRNIEDAFYLMDQLLLARGLAYENPKVSRAVSEESDELAKRLLDLTVFGSIGTNHFYQPMPVNEFKAGPGITN